MPHPKPSSPVASAVEAADNAAALRAHAVLVAQLCRPGACADHPGPAALIETHLSSLLVAGDQVYKLKKPLRNGFVDFSTLAARRAAGEQELRLNRRTAPRWYLGLAPVRQTASGPRLSAAHDPAAAIGPVLDWAVQMRRFDDSQRADRLATAGQLGAAQIDALAALVARFHAQLPPAPPGHGRADITRHWARENLAELATLLADPDWAARCDAHWPAAVAALQRWTEDHGAALAPLMDLRCLTGHVREVHGDLHLGNIVWADGEPVLFDALEFNELLRHIDTVGDLAFPFMDLLAHGQPRLAWRFISQVLDASGDHAALPLLAWWATYRAVVRAKVALLGADAADEAARDAALAQARRYLGVALALAGLGPDGAPLPARRRQLVLTCGLSGSGKSVAAALLAERLGAVRLRSDVERKRLFALPPTARAAPGLYSADTTRRTYDRLQELAAEALDAGVSVVVDAASLRRAERDAMRALASARGAAFHLLRCSAPAAVLQARVQARWAGGADPSDATPAVLAEQQAWAEWPGDDEAGDTWALDTDAPLSTVAARIDRLPDTGPA